ncbi:MAG: hypothetical protein H0W85_04245 [Methylotenera sp.]|nr:hypothetical protein [Methylotenera sp.]
MSLLIKALDNAERNKKAEKSKNLAGENQAGNAPLELEGIVPKATSPFPDENMLAETKTERPRQDFADKRLSLEEEAGLSLIVDPKYAKPKRSADKATEKANDKLIATSESEKTLKGNVQASLLIGSNQAPILPPIFQTIATQNPDADQKAAAKVFVANQSVKASSSKSALLILGVAGALMIWLGLQGYTYIITLLAPANVAVINPAVITTQGMATVAAEAAQVTQENTEPNDTPIPFTEIQQNPKPQEKVASNLAKTSESIVETRDDGVVQSSPENNTFTVAKSNIKNRHSKKNSSADTNGDEDLTGNFGKTPIKLVSKPQINGVDPTLLSAYQAFNHGQDALAQQQYRLVLQRDVRNVDALLGMAAIAQRQRRDADAFGWYQKVLEIEPRNTVAQSALINTQASVDSTATESKIKSMLAQQPEAAHLHEALGNLYAEQNQWPAAQEAYFNASRYAPNNADYAFNFAISLDHLGKSSLALIQYQRALDLVNKSGASSPDRAQLETRIRTLQ